MRESGLDTEQAEETHRRIPAMPYIAFCAACILGRSGAGWGNFKRLKCWWTSCWKEVLGSKFDLINVGGGIPVYKI
ncbi:hypothetical protein KCP78_11235 [Salmonella enterica subsp. enterica]|nr:hypothetical protein KCP78_11235 [Salmonella enterica subsp. enterica]